MMMYFRKPESKHGQLAMFKRTPVYCPDVFSHLNIESFFEWCSQPGWKKEHFAAELEMVFLEKHRLLDDHIYDDWIENGCHLEILKMQDCTDENCASCRSGFGGISFQWVSSLWTPATACGKDCKQEDYAAAASHAEKLTRALDFPIGGRWRTLPYNYTNRDDRYITYCTAEITAGIATEDHLTSDEFFSIEQRILAGFPESTVETMSTVLLVPLQQKHVHTAEDTGSVGVVSPTFA